MKKFIPWYDKNFGVFLTTMLFLWVLIVVILFVGCLSQPDKKDYIGRPDSCIDFATCMYYNSKIPDKNICADYAKECRAFGRYNFCKDPKNLPDRIDFEKCLLILNQK